MEQRAGGFAGEEVEQLLPIIEAQVRRLHAPASQIILHEKCVPIIVICDEDRGKFAHEAGLTIPRDLLNSGKCHEEGRALARLGFYPDATLLPLEDALRESETHSIPCGLLRIEAV